MKTTCGLEEKRVVDKMKSIWGTKTRKKEFDKKHLMAKRKNIEIHHVLSQWIIEYLISQKTSKLEVFFTDVALSKTLNFVLDQL